MRLRNPILVYVAVICFFSGTLFPGCSTWQGSGGDDDIQQFMSGVRIPKGDPKGYYQFGCYLQQRKQYRLSLDEFRKAVAADPDFAQAYNGMGVSYDMLREYRRAVACYKKALEINPELDYAYNNMGYSYILQGNAEAAAEAFQKAIALNQKNQQFHNNLALAYSKMGHFDAAYGELKLAGNEDKARRNLSKLVAKYGGEATEGKDTKKTVPAPSMLAKKTEPIDIASPIIEEAIIDTPTLDTGTLAASAKEENVRDVPQPQVAALSETAPELSLELTKVPPTAEVPFKVDELAPSVEELALVTDTTDLGRAPATIEVPDDMASELAQCGNDLVAETSTKGAEQWAPSPLEEIWDLNTAQEETVAAADEEELNGGISEDPVVGEDSADSAPLEVVIADTSPEAFPIRPIVAGYADTSGKSEQSFKESASVPHIEDVDQIDFYAQDEVPEVVVYDSQDSGGDEDISSLGEGSDEDLEQLSHVGTADQEAQVIAASHQTPPALAVEHVASFSSDEAADRPWRESAVAEVDTAGVVKEGNPVTNDDSEQEPLYSIQVGAYEVPEYAQEAMGELQEKGYAAHMTLPNETKPLYTVRVGQYPTREEADRESSELRKTEDIDTFIVSEQPLEGRAREKKVQLASAAPAPFSDPPSPIIPATTSKTKEVSRDAFAIEISNGNGVNRMARRVGEYLDLKGFSVTRLTNAVSFNHQETIVYYCEGYLQEAYQVAKQIPRYQNMKKVEQFSRPDVKVKVVIGRDMIAYDQELFFTAVADASSRLESNTFLCWNRLHKGEFRVQRFDWLSTLGNA